MRCNKITMDSSSGKIHKGMGKRLVVCVRLFQLVTSCILLLQLVDNGTSFVRNGMKNRATQQM